MAMEMNRLPEFFLTRRSRPARTLKPPAPAPEELHKLLTAAARTPDHGKLEPWRFIVLGEKALPRLARAIRDVGEKLELEQPRIAKEASAFSDSHLIVAVIGSPKDSPKIPKIEQTLSAGAVCLSLLNAALASGWGANWLTGIGAYDEGFRKDILGLEEHEFVAGFIHLGTATVLPPDRPRPDIDNIVTHMDA